MTAFSNLSLGALARSMAAIPQRMRRTTVSLNRGVRGLVPSTSLTTRVFISEFSASSATAAQSSSKPAGPIHTRIPPGDTKPRLVCDDCGFINYKNPLAVVGVVATSQDGRILLCRRNIMPRKGYFSLPAGFMECGEGAADGAAREAAEEADCRVKVGSLLALYSVPKSSQMHIYFRGQLDETHVSTTPTNTLSATPGSVPDKATPFIGTSSETSESILVHADNIPWAELAFPVTRDALVAHIKSVKRGDVNHVDCRNMTEMPPREGPLSPPTNLL